MLPENQPIVRELIIGDTHVDQYRALLRNGWSLEVLGLAVDLLHELLADVGVLLVPSSATYEEQADVKAASGRVVFRFADVEPFLEYIKRLHARTLGAGMQTAVSAPASAEGLPDELQALLTLAQRVQLSLAFPDLWLHPVVRIAGETGFYRDVQSIIVQCAILELLPELQAHREHPALAAEHDAFLLVILGHIDAVWRDEPAHYTHLQSRVVEYLGDVHRSGELKRLAFEQTPRGSHEYLTAAQIYWAHLMENRDYEAALQFVLDLYRAAEPAQLDEIKELIDDTYRAQAAADSDEPAGSPSSANTASDSTQAGNSEAPTNETSTQACLEGLRHRSPLRAKRQAPPLMANGRDSSQQAA